jgi:hypothetical protein
MTLTEFLLARIAEDEDLARRVHETGWPRHIAVVPESDAAEASVSIGTYGPKDNFRVWQKDHATEFGWTIHESGGIAWDPDRALRECEAKRRIVERHTQKAGANLPRHPICAECGGSDWRPEGGVLQPFPWVMPWPCHTLRALAEVYADHPDYGAVFVHSSPACNP